MGNENTEQKKAKKKALQRKKKREILEQNIWPALVSAGISQQFWPQKVGNHIEGEWEFVDVIEIKSNPHITYLHITYQMRNPYTKELHEFTIRYSNGAIAVVFVNNTDILVTKQHRPSIGKWVEEFPRSFTDSPGPGRKHFGELAEKKLRWLLDCAESWEVKNIASFNDDPGSRHTETQVYFVSVSISNEAYEHALLERQGGNEQTRKTPFQFIRRSVQEVDEMILQGRLKSLIEIGSWHFATRSKDECLKTLQQRLAA